MSARPLATAAGAVVAVAGLALAVAPGLAAGMGVGRFFVYAVAAAAAVLLVVDVRALVLAEPDRATPPEVEDGVSHPRAGAAVDALLADVAEGYDRTTQERRERLEARIRAAAVDVLSRRADSSPEAVEAMLVDGSWTDDPYAAAFLGAHDVADLPFHERVADVLRPEARFVRRATRAVHAVADLAAADRAAVGYTSADLDVDDGETGGPAPADPAVDGTGSDGRASAERAADDSTPDDSTPANPEAGAR